ncbi:hypothetical protein VTK56DRAFT_6188 [Thermocarpiscus australiensis]
MGDEKTPRRGGGRGGGRSSRSRRNSFGRVDTNVGLPVDDSNLNANRTEAWPVPTAGGATSSSVAAAIAAWVQAGAGTAGFMSGSGSGTGNGMSSMERGQQPQPSPKEIEGRYRSRSRKTLNKVAAELPDGDSVPVGMFLRGDGEERVKVRVREVGRRRWSCLRRRVISRFNGRGRGGTQ